MEKFENRMYEIGLLIEQQQSNEFAASIGHHVYEISLLLQAYKEQTTEQS